MEAKQVGKQPRTPRLCMEGLPVFHRTLVLREGSEGCSHDPYSWQERAVVYNGSRFVLRQGALGYSRFYINDRKVAESGAEPDCCNYAVLEWQERIGMTIEQFDAAYGRLHRFDVEDPMGPLSRYI